MGEIDVARQAPNVDRMRRFGATVVRREIRRPHAARGDRRGDPRLGVGPRRHVLPARLGDRAAPVSVSRAAAASRDRPRGARANARARRADCPTRCSPASAAARTRSAYFTAFSPIAASRSSASRPAAAARRSATTRRRCRTANPACCTARTRCCSTTSTARSRRRTRSRPVSTTPASVPSMRCCKRSAASNTSRPATTRRSRRSKSCAPPRASCPRSRARTRSRARSVGPRRIRGARVLIGLSGRGDKDMPILAKYPMAERRTCCRVTAFASGARARRQEGASRPALVAFITAGYPEPTRVPAGAARRRERGRRRRDRRAVLRSDGRRRHDPALEPARDRARREPHLDLGRARAARLRARLRPCC